MTAQAGISAEYEEYPQLPEFITIFSTKFAKTTPFWIKIGDTKYYMVIERSDNNYTYKDLLGCNKSKKQLFTPFKELDNDGDYTNISSSELSGGSIRFVSVKTSGKLELADKSKDFPLDTILYIDMMTTATYTDKYARPFGTFSMYVKSERGNYRKYIGHAGYVHPRLLEKLF